MTLINAGELARIQAQFAARFDSTATIFTYSRTPDGGGGFDDTWTAGLTVAARIAPVAGGEPSRPGSGSGVRGGRIDPRTTHVISLPAGTEVTASDQILMNGATYEVTAVRTRTDEIIRRAEVKEAPSV